MTRTLASETIKKIGKRIKIAGWVHARRNMGKIVFLDVFDRSGVIQAIVVPREIEKVISNFKFQISHRGELDEKERIVESIRPQWVLEIEGVVQERGEKNKNPSLATGNVEILAKKITVLAKAAELPFDLGQKELAMNLDTILNYRPLTLRHPEIRAVFELQSLIVESFRSFLRSKGFTEFQCPKIIAGDAEGGATVMKVDYVGHEASLAQSPQVYKQIMVGVFERAFTIGNVFRGESHNTSRHLNEYTSLDFEMGFIRDHKDVMRMENDWLIAFEKTLRKHASPVFDLYGAPIPKVLKKIPILTFPDAQDILEKEFGEKCKGEPDLAPQHEKMLCEYATKQLDSEFLFVTHYPTVKRPFYSFIDPKRPEYTYSFDLLFRGIEITTGGRRIEDYGTLLRRMREKNLKEEDFSFYLQIFKYGMPPHGGLAVGLERLTMKLLNLENIREATLFPRDRDRIDMPLTSTEKK